jgi:hypothetical protein
MQPFVTTSVFKVLRKICKVFPQAKEAPTHEAYDKSPRQAAMQLVEARGGKLELEPKWLETCFTCPLQMASAKATSFGYA